MDTEKTSLDVESEEWITHTLMEAERKRSIAKVLSLSSEDAVPKGSNYASQMYRLNVRVVNGSGELEERSVIYKALPASQVRRLGMKQSGRYQKESKVYMEVLPEFEKILKKNDIGGDTLWPDCYGIKRGDEGYLLQDLSAIGYKMGDRMRGYDFKHCSLVVDSLAKFHALGAVLIEKGELTLSDFDCYYFVKSQETADMLFKNKLNDLADALEQKWKGEWVEYAGRVRDIMENFSSKLVESFRSDTSTFRVLSHGDCWVNNVMFKYDKDGQPQCVKFLDFQLSYMGSPGGDLQYLFSSSLLPSEGSRKPELLRIYHTALDSYLTQFGYKADNRPSFAELEESYGKMALLGLGMALALRPLTMLPPSEVPDIEKISEEMAKGNKISLSSYNYEGEDFVNALKYALKSGKEQGIL